MNNKDNLLPGDRFPTVADEVASFTYWLIRDRQSEPIQGELPSYAGFHHIFPEQMIHCRKLLYEVSIDGVIRGVNEGLPVN